jgi:hypothetical protein
VWALFNGCSDNPTGPDQIIGSGTLVSEQRSVAAFTGIRVTGIGNVRITQDTVESLRIEADDNIIDRVTTSVNSGVLLVGLEQGSYNNVTINVYASMTTITRLEIVGAGDFRVTAPLQTDEIECRITGAGNITLSGTATDQTIVITGAGSVHNFDLVSATCSATISGTGSVEVNVTQQLDATISGTGSIVYAGNPPVVHSSVTGVGSIQPRS